MKSGFNIYTYVGIYEIIILIIIRTCARMKFPYYYSYGRTQRNGYTWTYELHVDV